MADIPVQYLIYSVMTATAAAWLGFVAARARSAQRRRLAIILLALLVVTIIWIGLPPLARRYGTAFVVEIADGVSRLFGVLWWLIFCLLLIVVLERVVWPRLPRYGMQVPKLLPEIVRGLVIALAGLGIIGALSDQPVTGVLAASGVIAIMLGFATQSTLGDIFSGIALNLERPYRVGDWVQIDKDVIGEVTEINWRATRLRSQQGNITVMPNSKLAAAQIVNFNYPGPRYRTQIELTVDARVPPERVARMLENAALKAPQVLADPPPEANLREFRDAMILYSISYWVDGYHHDSTVRDAVARNTWHALDMSGAGPGPLGDKLPPAVHGAAEARRLLDHVELFQDLDDAAKGEVAAAMRRAEPRAGDIVVRAGDAARSLFIIEDGVLEVSLTPPSGGRRVIGRLGVADVFGEMSLLTGAPRGADIVALRDAVVFEIDKNAFAPIVRRVPDCAQRLGSIIAQRQRATQTVISALEREQRRESTSAEETALIDRIRAFFADE